MRLFLRIRTTLFTGVILCGAGLSAHAALRHPPLRLHIMGADSSLTVETETILARAYLDLAGASGRGIPDTVTVHYVRAGESFEDIVGGRFPDWGVAAALGERNLIVMRSPADHPIGRSLTEILRHELAHLHLDQMAGLRQLPRWLHEGYAQQFAHEWRFGDDWIVARAAFSGQLLPLRDIDGVNSFQAGKAQLAYAQSYLAVGFFLQAYGWPGLLDFVGAIRDGQKWDDALATAIGTDYAGFATEYQAHLNQKYNWATFLGDTVILWIGLVVIFLVLYVIKRRNMARKRREWEAEDEIADILYGQFGGPHRGNQTQGNNRL